MFIFKITFWIFVILILHSYLFYPFLLIICSKISGKKLKSSSDFTPSLSILIPAHNEEKVIGSKIHSLYSSDYPSHLLEVIVGSDSSSDNTVQMTKELRKEYPSLKIIEFNRRTGKPEVINKLVDEASGEILILTDANVIPARDTIRKLTGLFADREVCLADTRPLNTGIKKTGISVPEAAYSGIEFMLKNAEGKLWGTLMGPFGGFYAIRKECYVPNPENTLADDFRIAMNILTAGGKCVSHDGATVNEEISDDLMEEFRRKVRISAGNFQNLSSFSYLLLKPFTILSFCFISHKVLRWVSPFLGLVVFLNSALLANHSLFFFLVLLLQLIFLILPPVDLILKFFGINLIPLRMVTHFCLANTALMAGFLKYLGGIRSGIWKPTKRNQ